MRIVSWNVEALPRWLDGALPAQWHRFGEPDVLCLQEVRVRPQDSALIAYMRAALPGYDCHCALNHDPHNGGFRGGRAYVAVETFASSTISGPATGTGE